MAQVELVRTGDLDAEDLAAIRLLCEVAFTSQEHPLTFDEDDWEHMLGGVHAVVRDEDRIVSHAAVVTRALEIDGAPIHTGYVEGVATVPELEGRGYATAAMQVVDEHIRATYRLGALATARAAFYQRLGWEVWRGPTSVRTPEGQVRTPEDDDAILILRTPSTPPIDLTAPISCEWRPGDVW